jgi:hypothetical protein
VSLLTLIGYWRNERHPELPDPRDFVDESWDPTERQDVADYLRNGFVPWVAMGFSPCRICGSPNGSVEYTDWTYIWPQGLSHYVSEHSVRLPREVVEHIRSRLDEFESPELVDDSWWLTVRPGE